MTIERITSNRWQGLSTDTKPTSGTLTNSTFRETDTNTDWIYDGITWVIKDILISPFVKKQGAHYPRGNISTSTLGCIGGLISNASSGTGIITGTIQDANGTGTTLDTVGTINSVSGWKVTSFTERLYNCVMQIRFLLTQTSDCRMYLGWSSGSGSNPASTADYLNALSGCGLWFDSAVSANWKIMSNSGSGASTVTDTTTAADTNIHTLSITATQTPSFVVALDGVTMTNGTITTPIPASTTAFGIVFYIENLVASSKTLKYYKLFVQSDI